MNPLGIKLRKFVKGFQPKQKRKHVSDEIFGLATNVMQMRNDSLYGATQNGQRNKQSQRIVKEMINYENFAFINGKFHVYIEFRDTIIKVCMLEKVKVEKSENSYLCRQSHQ